MNKKPYYRQSEIIFLLLGIIFFLSAIQVVIGYKWLFWATMLLVVIVVVFAITSSIAIEKKKH